MLRSYLGYRLSELHDAIEVLRKKPELGEICFKIFLPGIPINPYKSALEKEAKTYGYTVYFKPGNAGTTLGMLKDVTSEYWE